MSSNNIYRELQEHLDKMPIGFPATDSGIEIKILKYMFTEEEAKLVLCLTLMLNPVSKVKKRLKNKYGLDISLADLSKKLDALYMGGKIIKHSRSDPPKYAAAMLAIGMFEFQVDHLTPEFIEMLHQYFEEGFDDEFWRTSIPQLRTSPHMKAVVPEHKIATYDDMRSVVKNTNKSIQVANCVCKQAEDLLGKPCKRTDDYEVCLLFNSRAYLERGQARTITKEECLEILDKAEEKGLVLQPGNSLEPFCICLCCGCCCGVLSSAKKFPDPARLFATNFIVAYDEDKCKGCGVCVDRCQMDAITQVKKGEKVVVDLERCIGCGLCVTKCPKKALKLERKEKVTVPPQNIVRLYTSILKKKAGRKKAYLGMLRMLLGGQL